MIKRYNSRRLTEGTSLWSWMESEPNVPTILEGCGLVFINDKIKECSTGVCYVGKFDDLVVFVDIENGIYVDIFYNIESQEELRGVCISMETDPEPWAPGDGRMETVMIELPDGSRKVLRHKIICFDSYGELVDFILDEIY